MNLPTAITLSGFAAACIFGVYRRQGAAALPAAGFLFSLAGDYFLRNRGDGHEYYFLLGIAAYFLAHLGFLLFALRYGRLNYIVLWVFAVIYGGYGMIFLLPAMPDLALGGAVCLYTAVSVVSLAAAAGMSYTRLARICWIAGIALLLFSDTVISWKEFLSFHRYNFLIMPTYMASHLMLAAGLLLMIIRPARGLSAPAARAATPRSADNGPS